MGSKAALLQNGLGTTITELAQGKDRVVDLFCGSAAVSWFAAERTGLQVRAVDLQAYSAALARAVLLRTKPFNTDLLLQRWLVSARRSRERTTVWRQWTGLRGDPLRQKDVRMARQMCSGEARGTIWNAYGGYYFSPGQAETFDAMLRTLPTREPGHSLCKAALIQTASRCAASPGHTAQPFRPHVRALPHIATAWEKDPILEAAGFLESLARRHAITKGDGIVGDAVQEALRLSESDLVVLDPPYSAAQYSRFYHVLETVARGEVQTVTGAGRYPPFADRPHSEFSLKGGAEAALRGLLENLAAAGSCVILTFPTSATSNGLSGQVVARIARESFQVKTKKVRGRFSTLGGNNERRPSRHDTSELIVTMLPL